MTWWTNPQTIIKSKSRFIVYFGGSDMLITAKSCGKPSVSIETKEFRLTNHFFNYPGLAKWEEIEITFVDGDGGDKKFKELATAEMFNNILAKSGYRRPTSAINNNDTPEKVKSSGALLNSILIEQLAPGDTDDKKPRVTERWRLYNPIVTKLNWGSLDYGADDAVEYSMSIKYDYATFESPKQ